MNTARNLVFAWLMLLIASLLIGGMAFVLLDRQQDSLIMAAREADREQLSAVAETINLTVIETRDALSATLSELPALDYIEALEDWRLDNPLIRNVFVWTPINGVLFPDPARPTNEEERAFLQRFAGLFAQPAAWSLPVADEPAPPAPVQARRELTELAKARPLIASSPMAEADVARPPIQTQWRPWFWETGLHLLIWGTDVNQTRFGIELEMAALLSRLVTVLPAPADPNETWALLDDRGQVVHQRGEHDLTGTPSLPLSVPIGPSLPHWQVALYGASDAPQTGQSLLWLGSMLTLILIAAILLGGTLLLRQARRDRLDARRKTGFVSNVSHELRTPLTSIRMYAEMLAEQKSLSKERRQRYLQVIGNEAQRLTRLVNNLLDFSRLEQGRKQYHLQEIDLRALVARVLAAHAALQAGTPLQLFSNLPDCPVMCVTDGDAIGQVLLNLVDNALKYAAGGEVLSVTLSAETEQVRIDVTDHGPGIAPHLAEKIFTMFQRGDDSLTTRNQGCGLGLSIARQLIRDLGGDLCYRPRPEGGCIFTMTLPCNAFPGEKRHG